MVSTIREYKARRKRMIRYLGGSCVECGTTKNLQFDHVEASTKSFEVSKNWGLSWSKLSRELDKCQLLCATHHEQKTKRNDEVGGGSNKWSEIQHGTVWAYSRYGCRCDKCKKKKSEEYYRRKSARLHN